MSRRPVTDRWVDHKSLSGDNNSMLMTQSPNSSDCLDVFCHWNPVPGAICYERRALLCSGVHFYVADIFILKTSEMNESRSNFWTFVFYRIKKFDLFFRAFDFSAAKFQQFWKSKPNREQGTTRELLFRRYENKPHPVPAGWPHETGFEVGPAPGRFDKIKGLNPLETTHYT